jgi:hypothetical protein
MTGAKKKPPPEAAFPKILISIRYTVFIVGSIAWMRIICNMGIRD